MNSSLSVKDISENKADSTRIEELLVERYESLYFRIYLRTLFLRFVFFICILFNILSAIHLSKQPEISSNVWIFLLISMPNIALLSFFIPLIKSSSMSSTYIKINTLEDEIVKKKLKERFGSNSELKDRIEDCYIELNSLTKAKYETAFRFYAYEFYIYAIISSLIAGFFIFRLL